MKRFLTFAAIATLCASAAWAADFYVNGTTGNDSNDGSSASPVATIAKGIELASAGDNVNVAAGTYAGAIDINKGVTLLGPNADKTGFATNRVDEAIITAAEAPAVKLSAENAKFKGFTVRDTPSSQTHASDSGMTGVVNAFAANNAVIANNVVVGQPDNAEAKGPNGIVTQSGNYQSVEGNFVKDVLTTNRSGIKIQSCPNSTVANNKVTNIQYNCIALDSSGPSTVDGNIMENCVNPGTQGAGGNYTFTNNIINNTNTANKSGRGGLNVSNNAASKDFTIMYNKFAGNGVCAISYREVAGDVGTEKVNYNSFLGNAGVGLFLGRTGTVDATNNYWNSADGPTGTGADAISISTTYPGTVTSTPFAPTEFPNANVSEWSRF